MTLATTLLALDILRRLFLMGFGVRGFGDYVQIHVLLTYLLTLLVQHSTVLATADLLVSVCIYACIRQWFVSCVCSQLLVSRRS